MSNVPEQVAAKEAPHRRSLALLAGRLRPLKYYGLALLFVAGAGVLRGALPEALGPTPFLAFYLAWVGAAAFGGLGPGLLAVGASWLCVDLLFDPGDILIDFTNPATLERLVVLLAGGLTVSLIAERMRRGRIRERQQARELARAKREWERTFDAVPDLIAIIDPQHHILRANRAMAERLRAAPEACTGLTCYQCVHDLDAPVALCPHDQSLADGREHGVELQEDRLGGHFFVTCTPLHDEQGNMIGTVHVARDITARKRAEEALQQANERLREQAEELVAINRDLEQFAYIASHDLQEPLRAVSGFVSLLQQRYSGKLDEKADGYIDAAVDGAARMQALISGLLEYSRVGTRGTPPAPTRADEALRGALKNLQVLIQESGATIAADPLPTVQADAIQLTHLFQNLLANALKFRAERPPEVGVGARREDGRWVFWVRDNGIGIDPQYNERIFQIFQRLHTRRQYPGTGIGLAICKRIVERHGGSIWVESQPGQGATFYFTLPDKGEAHDLST